MSGPSGSNPAGPDVFAELLALATPERLLADPRATGEGVAVCLIDSGVERDLLSERCRQRGIEPHPIEGAVFSAESPTPLPWDGRGSSPHGTTVADIILRLAPRVRLYSADVFGPRGGCEVDVLMRALRWAVEDCGCRVVNLSLGVAEARLAQLPRRYQLMRAVEEAYYRDVVVVAAAHNDHPQTRSYPAAFAPPLLSVDKGLFDDPLRVLYRLRDQVEFVAHGRGYLGPFAAEPATSWAAPHLTGVVARLMSLRPSLKPFEVKTLLYWLSALRQPEISNP